MKWPNSLMLIRHDVSAYNVLRDKKRDDQNYKDFLAAWKKDPESELTRALAYMIYKKFSLGISDAQTPLADDEGKQARKTGLELSKRSKLPDVIFVSPYKRTLLTLHYIMEEWKELKKVKVYEDERIREQEHGLSLLYNDWKVFEALHPDQRLLRKSEGSYWYRYPQGESVPDVRLRNRSWLSALVRDYAGKNVLVVTQHLNILATRANLERWSAEKFIEVDEKDKPKNCSVTTYQGYPKEGADGKLNLECYNKIFY